MANIAVMTPHQSFSHQASPPPYPQHSSHLQPPHGLPTPYSSNSFAMSFDSSQTQSHSQPVHSYTQSFPNGPVSNGFARSFGEGYGGVRGYNEKPQIYTAVYSGVQVYEMELHGIACMRRRGDGWLNATQILKVAGVDKGKRTKVLEKEILSGVHEKVQGGYGKYQGTWISYRRGREFCRQYGVEDVLKPLLDYDVTSDGTSGEGQDTPTKEQAMAANRKRYYNSSLDTRPNGGPATNGTFFSNISPTTSVALAAMSKAARLNSPAPRAPSTQRQMDMRRPSQQDGFPASQQTMASQGSFDNDNRYASAYSAQPNGTGEPPRKRMRPDNHDDTAPANLPLDVSMRSATPTEPNESFLYDGAYSQDVTNGSGEPITLPPLPTPSTEEDSEKMNLILDLFAESDRTEYSMHPAITQLSGEDFNIPLDVSANNALHWAATLAKVPLLKLLIQKGASIWRGNAAGQSPLISAVIVNNCWEKSCFPELLELLNPLIEIRDIQGRTVLHHIAVSSGIKGRAPSSKYYLEALLEFLVRIGTQPQGGASAGRASATNGGQGSSTAPQNTKNPVSLVRFLSHIVNARDKAGNTALNLVARIGNRSIIQQLIEIHADPSLPNNKGVSAKDFGVEENAGEQTQHTDGTTSQQLVHSTYPNDAVDPALTSSGSQADDLGQDVVTSMTSLLTQNLAEHKNLLRQKTEQIDRLNEQIREFSALQKFELEKLQDMQARTKTRDERRARIANLRRSITEKRTSLASSGQSQTALVQLGDADAVLLSSDIERAINGLGSHDIASPNNRNDLLSLLPAPSAIRTKLNAYLANNTNLKQQADGLRSRSSELESLYRRVVSLCTGVAEEEVDEALPNLVAAVESERGMLGSEGEVVRVREFLRKVDGPSAVEQGVEL